MPSRNIKIALIPHDIVAGSVSANLDSVAKRLQSIEPDTDLIVLPEMFNGPFDPRPDVLKQVAESNDGLTMSTVSEWAVKYGVGICGGFTATDGCRFFNRGFFVGDDGIRVFYDKRHLFAYGGESRMFTPGMTEAPIISFRTWNIKLSICYDLRFPVWNRNRANEYDLLIVPANWAHARFFAWKHLLIARAIENQCFVAGCNREGSDLYGEYLRGDSMIFNNWGDNIGRLCSDGTVYATLDCEKFITDRQRFAPWRDADDFKLMVD